MSINFSALFQNAAMPSSFVPSLPSGSMRISVLDDAKAKAAKIEESAENKFAAAKSAVATEAQKVSAKVDSGKIELFSGKYYATCAVGGAVACGATHALVTPLDLVKCRKQVDKNLYKSNMDGWSKIMKTEGGVRGLYTGVGPTLFGYSMQGAAKYGFYEYFKKTYADMAGPENAVKYKDAIYLAGSASAEFIADVALVPMETVKVRMQTTFPPFANGALSGLSKVSAAEGTGALFKSLPSLWSRQIPYTMMKFWSFEGFVSLIYSKIPKPRSECSKLEQLGVSAAAGYAAGVFCAIVSHPADTMVSKLNAPLAPGAPKPTVSTIYKDIGFGGLWGGLGTRIIMIGTLTALQWLIYDTFKVMSGLPATGGAPAPQK